ncbi:ferredoxin, 2Fe-2S [Thermocrinis albus DSM 14484]|uniref:Ferredoxin, 2Fe-2S n=1 Tax=Thermocrinis albus (strain DSM 14484 / JCM 11386 / HI 11/12) TaxID=638303 RepID=D3SMM6_THEAH|nr:ferredoxin [Thermocrinis albus]ADC90006.1 ferredoxin, 2Fe-2S [Thermocrinis albus DSM 14484]
MQFRHVFVCVQQRPPGHPMGSCSDRGSRDVLQRLMEKVQFDPELFMSTMVTPTGCLNACGAGPIVVVYPEGVWYGNVRPEDVDEIVEKHLKGNEPVERLVLSKGKPPGMF